MQNYQQHHQVGGPAVHIAQHPAEGHHVEQVLHIPIGALYRGCVVEHQEYPSARQNNEKQEGRTAQSKGESKPYPDFFYIGGVEV